VRLGIKEGWIWRGVVRGGFIRVIIINILVGWEEVRVIWSNVVGFWDLKHNVLGACVVFILRIVDVCLIIIMIIVIIIVIIIAHASRGGF